MMKFVKIVGIAALIIVVITIIFSFIQPKKGHAEKSILINAPVEIVFDEVNTYQHFEQWSPWAKLDDAVKYTFEGPASGIGAKLLWQGKSMGNGAQWIEKSVPHSSVRNVISFEKLSGDFYLQFDLTPEGSGTRITWTYEGENKGFAGKFKWLFMKGPLNTQFEEGLHDLKYFIEKKGETQS
jgi:hypothetical protein